MCVAGGRIKTFTLARFTDNYAVWEHDNGSQVEIIYLPTGLLSGVVIGSTRDFITGGTKDTPACKRCHEPRAKHVKVPTVANEYTLLCPSHTFQG